MKKLISVLILGLMIVCVSGCEKENRLVNIIDHSAEDGITTLSALERFYEDEEYNYYFPSIRSELIECIFSDGTVMNFTEALNKELVAISDLDRFNIAYYKKDKNGNVFSSQGQRKEQLILQYTPYLYFEIPPLNEKNESISFSADLPDELQEKAYTDEKQLKPYADYLENRFGVTIDEKYKVTVHYSNAKKTSGHVEFKYFIDEIITNRYASFFIVDGKINRLFYYGMDKSVDEEGLIKRVNTFKDTYVQERYVLKENEEFIEETVMFSYNYQTDQLIYNYQVIFKQADGTINREYGTICLIDDNGYAITNKKY